MSNNTSGNALDFSRHGLSRRRLIGVGTAGILAAGLSATVGANPARANTESQPADEHRLNQLVDDAHARFASVADGKNANYIPYLASVPTHLFGIVMVAPDGKVIEAGGTTYAFAIESVAKVFTLDIGHERVRA